MYSGCTTCRGVCLSFGFVSILAESGKSPYDDDDEIAARDIYILKLVSFPRRPSIDRIPPSPSLFPVGQFSRSRQLLAFFRAREAHDSVRVRVRVREQEGEGYARSRERIVVRFRAIDRALAPHSMHRRPMRRDGRTTARCRIGRRRTASSICLSHDLISRGEGERGRVRDARES